ncbi:hypothetical protein [Methylovorus glucosotrophus]|uniref:Uncharacterized protein n=1 Tax=Methylovorus glucosotrophus (strain SIP3-4) TaxID=582744 RepID=C6X800_METGS|nr:hypothetical protein [Methylovorus glucosotrophus]ACT51327.1 hypothetical protein Msip34_2085 [Methylovorus glucosotrophus SIP3-4]
MTITNDEIKLALKEVFSNKNKAESFARAEENTLLAIHGNRNIEFFLNRTLANNGIDGKIGLMLLKEDYELYNQDIATMPMELFLQPFLSKDISFIDKVINRLFINNSNQDVAQRMLIAYSIFSYACQCEHLALHESTTGFIENGILNERSHFRWVYITHLAYMAKNGINANEVVNNSITYFNYHDNKEIEAQLDESHKLFRQVVKKFIEAILKHTNNNDFKVVINYFKDKIKKAMKNDYENHYNFIDIISKASGDNSFNKLFK